MHSHRANYSSTSTVCGMSTLSITCSTLRPAAMSGKVTTAELCAAATMYTPAVGRTYRVCERSYEVSSSVSSPAVRVQV